MDSQSGNPFDSTNGNHHQSFNNGAMSPPPEDFLNYDSFFSYQDTSMSDLTSVDFSPLQTDAFPPNFTSNGAVTAEETGSPDDNGFDSVLKYISQVLMEENMDDKPCMFHDPLALQSAEKPFFDALGNNNLPLSPNQHPLSSDQFVDSPDDTGVSVESSGVQESSISPVNFSVPVGFDIFTDRESMLLFQKGVDEASKFLPKTSKLVIDLNGMTFPEESKGDPVAVKSEKARRVRYLDDEDLEEGRSSKLSAVSVEEEAGDLSEMFDRVLLCPAPTDEHGCDQILMEGVRPLEAKRQEYAGNVVDLRSLLIQCAQAVTSDDRRTAHELLKQIRGHSSPQGDGSQRLAHYFANALEARLEGTGSLMYTALASKRSTAVERLKAYQFFVSFCPFKKLSIMFSILNIMKVSENRKKLHVIDFGICYGFQWPALIQLLSQRPEGPPFLRITGIELPQPGFRPAQSVEETGRRLAKYCGRFGVPFEFIPIAQKWETVKLEDLKLEEGEVVAVNSLFRFKNLLDETVVVDSPRDAVLNLIKRIKPDIFVHAIINGSFSAPFFITRFREALFHYSTLFDMFDMTTNVPREDLERSMFEREFLGREIMNVVACEGTERVERPEIYKQWQVRSTKAGYRQFPLDPEIIKRGRHKMTFFHKDYSLNVDGNWLLMGWKGRVVFAISAWVPS